MAIISHMNCICMKVIISFMIQKLLNHYIIFMCHSMIIQVSCVLSLYVRHTVESYEKSLSNHWCFHHWKIKRHTTIQRRRAANQNSSNRQGTLLIGYWEQRKVYPYCNQIALEMAEKTGKNTCAYQRGIPKWRCNAVWIV